ncbi:MAG TPA: ankyrin repeat domain-containing protein [Nitrospirota bacterium]|nr:ankyrin repeat domain-containing protein [Nitrospirota bacterium]
MESTTPGSAKGYQKQVKKEPPPKPKANRTTDYSSPMAKKWPLFLNALESGNVDDVKQIIEDGLNVNVLRDGVTPLMIAASKGQTEIAEVILQAGVNINAKSDDGETALHKAAFDQEKTDVVQLLMESGIDIDAKNKAGKTAFNLAEEKKHRDIVRAIKQHQAKLRSDAQDWDDFLNSAEGKPFKQSRLYDSMATVFRFWWLPTAVLCGTGLLLGFLFNAVIIAGITGIVLGSAAGFSLFLWEKKLRTYLVELGPLPELDIETIRQKRMAGEPILIRTQQETSSADRPSDELKPADIHHLSPNDSPSMQADDWESPEEDGIEKAAHLKKKRLLKIIYFAVPVLVLAVLLGAGLYKKNSLVQWYFTKKLENKGIPFSDQAFLAEASKNNEAIMDLFIRAGVNLSAKNEKGQTVLIIAAEKGYANTIVKLAKLNPSLLKDADNSGNTALMMAVREGREDIVRLLRENGSDVNYIVPSREGAASALQAALDTTDFKDDHMRIMQYLLQNGANVKSRNASGRFPLLFAVDHGLTEAAKILIEHGADVNDADQEGNFSLMSAACNGYPWLAALLVEKGANMQMALSDGSTPLMCAVQGGHVDMAKALLEKGANVNAKTTSGMSALNIAAGAGNIDLVKMLLAQGAEAGAGYIPDSFIILKGKIVALSANKNKISDMLKRIARTASRDGYRINVDPGIDQKGTMKAKAPWNAVLIDVAAKNHLFLLVRGKEVFVLPSRKRQV